MGKTVKEIIEEEYGSNLDEYKDDFTSLVIEAEDIIEFTEEDKKYLENFPKMINLIIISCKLKSLKNLPDCEDLQRLELSDNNISGDLKALSKYPNLKNLKLCGNKIKSLEDIEDLKTLPKLEILDLIETPLSETEGYKEKIWEMFKDLKVLDNLNKEGEECLSELEIDGFDGEGEGDLPLMDFLDPTKLTEEEKQALERQGITFIEGEGEGDVIVQIGPHGEGDEEEAEGEEDEKEAEEEAKPGKKRAREDEAGAGNKRQKTEE
ncbi:unnamed protein product [Moneuplotes crassus]|uniref:Uncharacterized protein n=1 Tax=Euplotes crassus TaxID=5936 RepID=A0AAD1UNI2_EUPCR|nr:unnamed protein product [Moneuplotes crassus]